MPNPAKVEIVNEIKEKLAQAEVAVLTDYKGLNVAEINDLRNRFKAANVEYKVYKNRLINLAAKDLGIEGLDKYLEGPTAVALGRDDVASPVRVSKAFINEFSKLQLKGGLLGKQVLDIEQLDSLLTLPTKAELIPKVIGGIQAPLVSLISMLHRASPIVPLVNVLQGNLRNLTSVLHAIAEQKEKDLATAPAEGG